MSQDSLDPRLDGVTHILGCAALGAIVGGIGGYILGYIPVWFGATDGLPSPGHGPVYVALGASVLGAPARAIIGGIVGAWVWARVRRRDRG